MHKDFNEIFQICFSGRTGVPDHIRLFLADEKKALYINKGSVQSPSTAFGMMESIRADRGSVLESFANFEFLIIEFVRLKVAGFEYNKKLIDIIQSLSARQRIQILGKWKVIDRDFTNKLNGLFDIRNLTAHSVMKEEIEYNNKYIFNVKNFAFFKKEMQETWNKLIEEYNKMTEQIDFSELIQEIKQFKEKK